MLSESFKSWLLHKLHIHDILANDITSYLNLLEGKESKRYVVLYISCGKVEGLYFSSLDNIAYNYQLEMAMAYDSELAYIYDLYESRERQFRITLEK